MNCIRQRAVRHINARVRIYADVSIMHAHAMHANVAIISM